MTDKQSTDSGGNPCVGNPAGRDVSAYNGIDGRRLYAAPRILSSEDLELAAAGCGLAGEFGKSFPACQKPGT